MDILNIPKKWENFAQYKCEENSLYDEIYTFSLYKKKYYVVVDKKGVQKIRRSLKAVSSLTNIPIRTLEDGFK